MQRLPVITEDMAHWVAATPALTARDREVFGLLVDERSQRQIAVVLSISVNTVRGRIRRLLRKLDGAAGEGDLLD